MTIKDYALAVGVTETTIKNDLSSGRLTFTLIVGERRPIYDIDIKKNPLNKYNRRRCGRPKGVKNKTKCAKQIHTV